MSCYLPLVNLVFLICEMGIDLVGLVVLRLSQAAGTVPPTLSLVKFQFSTRILHTVDHTQSHAQICGSDSCFAESVQGFISSSDPEEKPTRSLHIYNPRPEPRMFGYLGDLRTHGEHVVEADSTAPRFFTSREATPPASVVVGCSQLTEAPFTGELPLAANK